MLLGMSAVGLWSFRRPAAEEDLEEDETVVEGLVPLEDWVRAMDESIEWDLLREADESSAEERSTEEVGERWAGRFLKRRLKEEMLLLLLLLLVDIVVIAGDEFALVGDVGRCEREGWWQLERSSLSSLLVLSSKERGGSW